MRGSLPSMNTLPVSASHFGEVVYFFTRRDVDLLQVSTLQSLTESQPAFARGVSRSKELL